MQQHQRPTRWESNPGNQNASRNQRPTDSTECFGGVNDRDPHHLALTSKCPIDLSTPVVVTPAVASVDAAQCHNGIQHTTASPSCQAWGVPIEALATLLHTVQHMNLQLGTACGNTDETIPNATKDPFQGILQGNGAGLVTWPAISAFQVHFQHQQGHTNNVMTPINCITLTPIGPLVVDDTQTSLPFVSQVNQKALSTNSFKTMWMAG